MNEKSPQELFDGYFGEFGGRYVPETLMNALHELEAGLAEALTDPDFMAEYQTLLRQYAGRETPLYEADNLTRHLKGARIFLKREDLNHTGSHKINNVIGQALLARRMGKKNIIAETGAGQHGVATATICAKMGLNCEVFMGTEDIRRQAVNVEKMKLLGAKVTGVDAGTGTLKDATSEAIRTWVARVEDTCYIIGSVVGPHPYPYMVREFQKVIGEETREQILRQAGRLPEMVVACVGGGSNAMGIFHAFVPDEKVALVGVEAAGLGLHTPHHAAAINGGSVGVIHGMLTYLMQDECGGIAPVHSISAGLDYPGIGPEHAHLAGSGRVRYESVTDEEALAAFCLMSEKEGIIPALESAHAIAYALRQAPGMPREAIMIINLSGRGDKDMHTVMTATTAVQKGGCIHEQPHRTPLYIP
ncbi:tryptophan synthase subunit beta [Anoxynatronum buryatiense]|nr:tryptophan synthase subunit beta [Anoxynatronum buryatiense]